MANAWEKRPAETAKAYAAFQVYLSLSPYGEGENRRSIRNTAAKLGLDSVTSVSGWSTNNDWVARATAYDAAMGNAAIEARQVGLADFQEAVTTNLSAQLLLSNQIIGKILNRLNKKLDALQPEDEVPYGEVKKALESMRINDDLSRRLAGLPTQFSTVKAEEVEEDDQVFIIGD